MNTRIAILPCTGVGQTVGTIARQAAYRVCDDMRPQDTVLVCLPALVKGIQEDIDMIQSCPVIVIEGCGDCCASYALQLRGGKPSQTISVLRTMKGTGLTVKRETRQHLNDSERQIVELVSNRVIEAVDQLKITTGEHTVEKSSK